MSHSLLLCGPDGGNPIGFMAALGAFRTLTNTTQDRELRLSWELNAGTWRSRIHADQAIDEAGLILDLDGQLRNPADPRAFTLQAAGDEPPADTLRLPVDRFREVAQAAVEAYFSGTPCFAEFISAWASQMAVRNEAVQDTPFQFTSGQQKFLVMARELIENTTADHLRSTLFQHWTYRDPGPSLRWDPLDESRRYALNAIDPTNSSGNPIRTMRGANRLAIEALPLLPVLGDGVRLLATGFSRDRRPYWSWPIWTAPMSLSVVRSLLSIEQLRSPAPPRNDLLLLGIADVYRTSVILPTGRYRNFTPAQPV